MASFDLIGDVHGCLPELLDLLGRLGYTRSRHGLLPPKGRHLVFVGDLVDRGPDVAGTLELAMEAVTAGHASCVLGNHDADLLEALQGRNVPPSKNSMGSLTQLVTRPAWFLEQTASFLASLPPRLSLDGGRLRVVHAGDRPELPEPERSVYNVYGRDTDETDEYGYPLRDDWVKDYGGEGLTIYGHTPVVEPLWRGATLNLDTGCVFGGKLTALRYPELTLVSAQAHDDYAPSKRFNRGRR